MRLLCTDFMSVCIAAEKLSGARSRSSSRSQDQVSGSASAEPASMRATRLVIVFVVLPLAWPLTSKAMLFRVDLAHNGQ